MTLHLFQNMYDKADNMRKEYGINTYPVNIEDMEQIFYERDYEVEYFSKCTKSCLIGNMLIIGNTNLGDDLVDESIRRRESLAHEIGHLATHQINQVLDVNNMTFHKEEAQAEAFKLYFLMPENVFEEFYEYSFKTYGRFNKYEASIFFGVSEQSVKQRRKYFEKSKKEQLKLQYSENLE